MEQATRPSRGSDPSKIAKVIESGNVDAARYDDIASISRQVRNSLLPSDSALAAVAARTLFLEARLLDGRRYRDWLELLTSDYAYWIPGSDDIDDARIESAVNFDDHRRMIDRIALIETDSLHAQIPPSRACRIVTNIEAWPHGKGRLLARSNLAIWEYRRGTTTMFAGSQVHELVEAGDTWAIRTRIIHLLDCDEPQGNVTFIL